VWCSSSSLAAIIAALTALGTQVPAALRKAAEARSIVATALDPVSRESKAFNDEFDPKFVVTKHPLVVALGTLGKSGSVLGAHWAQIITLIPVLGDWIAEKATAKTEADEKPSKAGALVKKLLGVPPPPPSLAPAPTLPAPLGFVPALTKAAGTGPWKELEDVGKAMSAASKALVAPTPNVFAPAESELAKLEKEAATRAAETAVYLRIARHAVAPAVAANIRSVEDVLRDLDRQARPRNRLYPVRDVVPVQPLHLAVRRLVVTGEGRSESGLRRFSREVQRAMGKQVYEIDLVSTDLAVAS
jgi:hypothetical protein